MAVIIDNKKLIELDKMRDVKLPQIIENKAYVKGQNPETLNELPQKAPDNRVTIPLAKMAVETLCGYAGRAGDIQVHFENVEDEEKDSTDDEYIVLRKRIAEHNEADLETSELYETGITQGKSYELFWVSDDLNLPGMMTPEYKKIPNGEVVLLWSRDLKPVLEAGVRFQKFDDDHVATVYYPLFSEEWIKPKGVEKWTRNKEGDTQYPYESVPINIYPINSDMTSVFQAEKPLITANDKLLNKSLNEVDRFNAMIALFPGLADKDFKDKLIEMGVIDNLQEFERWPEYLQKDLSGVNEFYNMIADRLEKLFYKSIKIPDFTDKDFANAESGLAMAYKLIGLEFIASKIDMYFYKGLKQRNKLINDVISMNSKFNVDDYKIVIKSVRNLPVDKAALVDLAIKLNGILSREALLRILPKDILDDVEKELERQDRDEPETEEEFSTDED